MKKIVLGILRYIPFLTLFTAVTLTIAGCSTDEINKGMYEELSKLQTKGMNRTAVNGDQKPRKYGAAFFSGIENA